MEKRLGNNCSNSTTDTDCKASWFALICGGNGNTTEFRIFCHAHKECINWMFCSNSFKSPAMLTKNVLTGCSVVTVSNLMPCSQRMY
jgi:hypothetical protein